MQVTAGLSSIQGTFQPQWEEQHADAGCGREDNRVAEQRTGTPEGVGWSRASHTLTCDTRRETQES